MAKVDLTEKVQLFQNALNEFKTRLLEDRYILAAVQIASFMEETIWCHDSIGLWIIEEDGVSHRLKSDGKNERIFRTFVENGINIHCEIIPRSRFRLMVEGNSRTAFSCNFFSKRELIFSKDPSIEKWFSEANQLATSDQEKELLVVMTWVICCYRHALRRLQIKNDLPLTTQDVLDLAHSIAHLEIVRGGEIYEKEAIYKAIDTEPELFQTIYLDVLSKRKSKKLLQTALDTVAEYMQQNALNDLRPVIRYLKKQNRIVPLSELAEHFAHSQLYPWHIETALLWLEENGMVDKLSSPFGITKKSRVEIEEPAWFLEPS